MSSDPSPADSNNVNQKLFGLRGLLGILNGLINKKEPSDRDDIDDVLNTAFEKNIIDKDSYNMIQGALSFTEKSADDIALPRSKMDVIDVNSPVKEVTPFVIEATHSRFPVYEEDRDNIIGLLLAKDLLKVTENPDLTIRDLLRPAHFVPETKRLDLLLKELRETRNHLALVIDEHGSLTGLVTMEDILEQIVGHIEDEHDEVTQQMIFPESETSWRVMASIRIEDFNLTVNGQIPDDEYDTIGGWLTDMLDHIPRRGDSHTFEDLVFEVLRADERRALWLHVKRLPAAAENA